MRKGVTWPRKSPRPLHVPRRPRRGQAGAAARRPLPPEGGGDPSGSTAPAQGPRSGSIWWWLRSWKTCRAASVRRTIARGHAAARTERPSPWRERSNSPDEVQHAQVGVLLYAVALQDAVHLADGLLFIHQVLMIQLLPRDELHGSKNPK